MAVGGAAMEFGAGEGIVEDVEGCGSGDWNQRVYEESREGKGKFGYCLWPGIDYELAFSWLGRRCAKTWRPTRESDGMAVGSGRI